MAGEGIDIRIGVSGTQQATNALQTVATAAKSLIGLEVTRRVATALASAYNDATESAVAMAQLERTLISTGNASSAFQAQLVAQADALESLTGNSDESIIAVQRLLLSMGATASEVTRLTPLVADLAANLGGDLTSAARLVGSALDGEAIGLGKLNITASNTEELIQKLTRAVGGQAAALKDARGPGVDVQTALSRFNEAAGGFIKLELDFYLERVARAIELMNGAMANGRLNDLQFFIQSRTLALMEAAAAISSAVGLINDQELETIFAGTQGALEELKFGPKPKRPSKVAEVAALAKADPLLIARQNAELELEKKGLDLLKEQREAMYEQGLLSLDAYFEERQQQIEEAYRLEVRAAQLAAEAVKDPAQRKLNVETQVSLALRQKAIDQVKLDQDVARARVKAIEDVAAVEAEQMQDFRKHQAERLQSEVELQQRLLQVRQDTIAAERARVQADFRLTSVERRQRELDSMREELRLIEEQTAALIRRRDALDPNDTAGRETINQRIDGLNSQGRGLSSQLGARGAEADPTSFADQSISALNSIVDRIGTAAQQVRRSIESIGDASISSIAEGMNGLLQGTLNWEQALGRIRQGIANGITQAISRMFAEWIVGRTAVFLKELALAPLEAAAKAPGALLTSISSFGTAAIVGLAAITAAMAAFGGFAGGGYTGSGGKYEPAGIVHRGEYVFTKDEVEQLGLANIMAFRDSARRGYSMGGAVAFSPSISPTVNVAPAGLTVVVLKDPNELRRFAESHGGRMTVVNAASGNRLDLGVGT